MQQMLPSAARQIYIVTPARFGKTDKRALSKFALLRVVDLGTELIVVHGEISVEVGVVSHGEIASKNRNCSDAIKQQARQSMEALASLSVVQSSAEHHTVSARFTRLFINGILKWL